MSLAGPMFEPKETEYWKSPFSKDGAHYNLFGTVHGTEMDAIKNMFPDGKANELNFILFSTSGVHGTYTTIEEVEAAIKVAPIDRDLEEYYPVEVTFLIVHPRICCLRYGNVRPLTQSDIDFLKALRQSSWEAIKEIGNPDEEGVTPA